MQAGGIFAFSPAPAAAPAPGAGGAFGAAGFNAAPAASAAPAAFTGFGPAPAAPLTAPSAAPLGLGGGGFGGAAPPAAPGASGGNPSLPPNDPVRLNFGTLPEQLGYHAPGEQEDVWHRRVDPELKNKSQFAYIGEVYLNERQLWRSKAELENRARRRFENAFGPAQQHQQQQHQQQQGFGGGGGGFFPGAAQQQQNPYAGGQQNPHEPNHEYDAAKSQNRAHVHYQRRLMNELRKKTGVEDEPGSQARFLSAPDVVVGIEGLYQRVGPDRHSTAAAPVVVAAAPAAAPPANSDFWASSSALPGAVPHVAAAADPQKSSYTQRVKDMKEKKFPLLQKLCNEAQQESQKVGKDLALIVAANDRVTKRMIAAMSKLALVAQHGGREEQLQQFSAREFDALQQIREKLNKPGSAQHSYRARVARIKAAIRASGSAPAGRSSAVSAGLPRLDSQQSKLVDEVLGEHHKALKKLVDVVQEDIRDMRIMLAQINANGNGNGNGGGGGGGYGGGYGGGGGRGYGGGGGRAY